jgi:hypothetical protein
MILLINFLSQKLHNDNEASQQRDIYPKLGLGKDLFKSNVTPAFQIPTPPATPEKKPICKSSGHCLSSSALVRLDNQLSITKLNLTPRSTSIDTNSDPPCGDKLKALSKSINKRSELDRKNGLCKLEDNPFAKLDDETPEKIHEFLRNLPSKISRIVLLGPAAIFQNGQSLKYYQAADLAILLRRERGEKVCGTDTVNNIGYILAYEMGFASSMASCTERSC